MENKLVTRFLCVAFFIPFIINPKPPTLDINTFRLLALSIVSTISISYFFLSKELTSLFFEALKSKISIAILLFIVWGFLSFFYATNQNEVILRGINFIVFYMCFLSLYVLVAYNKFTFINISIFFSIVVLVAMYYSYASYINITSVAPYNFEQNVYLKGLFSNRNVTAAVYMYSVPFLFYLYLNSKSLIIKLLSIITSVALLHMIFLLAARTSYVIILILTIAIALIAIIDNQKINRDYLITFIAVLGFTIFTSTWSLGTKNDAHAINRINSIDFNEESTNTRLRYYRYGFDQILKNPLLGVGLGNWKIESILKDKNNIVSYVIPYTMHNDFLEVGAELGLIGLIIYIISFWIAILYLFNLYKTNKNRNYVLTLFLCILIYIIDANINFPFIRISQQLYLASFFALALYFSNKKNENIN